MIVKYHSVILMGFLSLIAFFITLGLSLKYNPLWLRVVLFFEGFFFGYAWSLISLKLMRENNEDLKIIE